MASDSPYVQGENRWWRERIDALGESEQNGVSAITHYARSTRLKNIAAGAAVTTWADLVEGDLYQITADLINDVLAACAAADVDRERVLELARTQRT